MNCKTVSVLLGGWVLLVGVCFLNGWVVLAAFYIMALPAFCLGILLAYCWGWCAVAAARKRLARAPDVEKGGQ